MFSALLNISDGFATFLVAVATLLTGLLAIGGALLAWKSVQRQIASTETIEKNRQASELAALQAGFTAELMVFASGVVQAASVWNQRALKEPDARVSSGWPVMQEPLFYRSTLQNIGRLPQPWVAAALIGFYMNLLELNDQAREELQGRPTVNATNQSVASRLQLMAANMSQAIDGLNNDRKFSIPREMKLDILVMPTGITVSKCKDAPESLQDVLLRMANIVAPKVTPKTT